MSGDLWGPCYACDEYWEDYGVPDHMDLCPRCEKKPMALDIGSGHNPVQKSGWREAGDVDHLRFTNMDFYHPEANYKWDFNNVPWPFKDDTFQVIFARHALEHVQRDKLIAVMKEIHRVAKRDAHIQIRVPYWNSEAFPGDPTHWNPFVENTFRQFCVNGGIGTDFYVPPLFEMTDVEYRFQPKFRFIPKKILKELMHVLCGVCDEMWLTLRIVKSGSDAPDGYHPRYRYDWNAPAARGFAFIYGAAFYGGLAVLGLAAVDLILTLLRFGGIL